MKQFDYFGVPLKKGDVVGCACGHSSHLPYSPNYEWLVYRVCDDGCLITVAPYWGAKYCKKVSSRLLVRIEPEC